MRRQKVQEYLLTFPNEFAADPVTPFVCLLWPNIQADRLEKSVVGTLSGKELSAFHFHPVSGKCCERWLFAHASHPPCAGRGISPGAGLTFSKW